jgi:hypothetical protein
MELVDLSDNFAATLIEAAPAPDLEGANQCLARIPEGGIDDKGDDINALKACGDSVPKSRSPISCFSRETGIFSKKNREAIEHERAITERD